MNGRLPRFSVLLVAPRVWALESWSESSLPSRNMLDDDGVGSVIGICHLFGQVVMASLVSFVLSTATD